MTDSSPRKKPKQERAKATVASIVEATAQLLVEGGFHNLSTNKIAEAAGVSIGSLYQYFPNKEAVVAAVVNDFADRQFELLVDGIEEMDDDSDLDASVRGLLRTMFDAKKQEPELSKVLFEELPSVGQIDMLKEWNERACAIVRLALEVRADEIRPTNLDLAAFVVVTACHGIVHSTVIDRRELLENDQLAEETADLVLRYLKA